MTNINDMALPKGKTYNDCRHIGKCKWFVGREGHETECDWSPSRFSPKTKPEPKEDK